MPPWVGSVLAVLRDPRTISLAALALSWWSFRRTSRLTALQTRIADLELKNPERIEASRTRADIRATLYGSIHSSHRIALENVGAAPAFGVDIEFLDEKGSPLPESEREEKLPISQLDAGPPVTLLAALASGRWPPFKIALSWSDPDGTPHRKETILYESTTSGRQWAD
jgi:hypothetical protein